MNEDKKYYLKETMFFEDGNSIDTDVFIKKVSPVFAEGWVKVETTEEYETKRIFWAKEDSLVEHVEIKEEYGSAI